MPRMQDKTLEIIKKVAKEYNLPEFVVEEVFLSEFRFVRDKIQDSLVEGCPTVLLQKFGKFFHSPKQLASWKRNTEDKLRRLDVGEIEMNEEEVIKLRNKLKQLEDGGEVD